MKLNQVVKAKKQLEGVGGERMNLKRTGLNEIIDIINGN